MEVNSCHQKEGFEKKNL